MSSWAVLTRRIANFFESDQDEDVPAILQRLDVPAVLLVRRNNEGVLRFVKPEASRSDLYDEASRTSDVSDKSLLYERGLPLPTQFLQHICPNLQIAFPLP